MIEPRLSMLVEEIREFKAARTDKVKRERVKPEKATALAASAGID